jgi:hypothetical protein
MIAPFIDLSRSGTGALASAPSEFESYKPADRSVGIGEMALSSSCCSKAADSTFAE